MPKPYYILLLIPFLNACFSSELKFEDQFEPVVEAYLYVDKNVENFKLSSMISFGADSSGGAPITNALITLERDLSAWDLIHNDSVPGSYYLEVSPNLAPGDTLNLHIGLDEKMLLSTTVIPGNPPAVSMSSRSIYIPKVDDPRDFQNVEMPDPVELSWDNPEAKYYFLSHILDELHDIKHLIAREIIENAHIIRLPWLGHNICNIYLKRIRLLKRALNMWYKHVRQYTRKEAAWPQDDHIRSFDRFY